MSSHPGYNLQGLDQHRASHRPPLISNLFSHLFSLFFLFLPGFGYDRDGRYSMRGTVTPTKLIVSKTYFTEIDQIVSLGLVALPSLVLMPPSPRSQVIYEASSSNGVKYSGEGRYGGGSDGAVSSKRFDTPLHSLLFSARTLN